MYQTIWVKPYNTLVALVLTLKQSVLKTSAMALSALLPLSATAAEHHDVNKFIGEDTSNREYYGVLSDVTVVGGQVFLVAISAIAFIWVAYTAIAKFRECQKGMADWAELMVLGVAAAMLLVFVSILLTNTGDLLVPDGN